MLEVHSLNDVLSCLLDDVKPIDLSITSNFQMTNYSEEAGCRGYQICMHLSKHTLHTESHFQFRFKLESMDRSRSMFLQKIFSAVLVSSKIQNWYGSQQILIQQQVIYYNMHDFSNLLWHLSKSFKLWSETYCHYLVLVIILMHACIQKIISLIDLAKCYPELGEKIIYCPTRHVKSSTNLALLLLKWRNNWRITRNFHH